MQPSFTMQLLKKSILPAVVLAVSLLCAQVSMAGDDAGGFHQADRAKQQTLRAVLRSIERQHNVSFLCRTELLDIRVNTAKVDFSEKEFYAKLQNLLRP